MKIIDKGNFRTALQFSGVLKLNGEKINSFIRSLETPSHDKLEYDRHDEPKYAKKVLEALNKLIREKVGEFSKVNDGEELDMKGVSRFLPDSSKENEILNYSLKNGEIKSITQEKYEKKNKKKNTTESDGHIEELPMSQLENGKMEGGKTKSQDTSDTISLPNENSNSASSSDNKLGKNDEGKKVEVITETGKNKLFITKRKALVNDHYGKKYKLILESLKNCEIYFHLKSLYEDGKGEVVSIEKSYTDSNEDLKVKENRYVSTVLEANKKQIFYVELEEEIYSSMEVVINAK